MLSRCYQNSRQCTSWSCRWLATNSPPKIAPRDKRVVKPRIDDLRLREWSASSADDQAEWLSAQDVSSTAGFKPDGMAYRLATQKLQQQQQRGATQPAERSRPRPSLQPAPSRQSRTTNEQPHRQWDRTPDTRQAMAAGKRQGSYHPKASTTVAVSQPRKRPPRQRRPRFESDWDIGDNDEFVGHKVDFPDVTVPTHVFEELTPAQEAYLQKIAGGLRTSRIPELLDPKKYIHDALTLKSGKGDGRGQIPYVSYMLLNNRTANGETKRAVVETVASMIVKRFKTKRRLVSNR